MQFGIFTVGDITTDPATGKAPSEHQRIKNTVEMAVLAEQAGLDFFATGEHHNPPFAPSSPPTLLANIAARTDKLLLTTATTLITTNDPVRLAEEYAYLQHLSDGRVDLMMGRGNTGPVYPWFGKDRHLDSVLDALVLTGGLAGGRVGGDVSNREDSELHATSSLFLHWFYVISCVLMEPETSIVYFSTT